MYLMGKFWQNCMLAAPPPTLEGWRPHLREILDPPLDTLTGRERWPPKSSDPKVKVPLWDDYKIVLMRDVILTLERRGGQSQWQTA